MTVAQFKLLMNTDDAATVCKNNSDTVSMKGDNVEFVRVKGVNDHRDKGEKTTLDPALVSKVI